MAYLRRKLDDYLVQWGANDAKYPLIVKGPRQVGKTESIRRFARQSYANVIEINFVEEPKYKAIVTDGYGVEDVVKNISLIDPSKQFIEGETLLFFDEIQEFPDIATTLKFFKIDGRFDVICSGSMLGISYKKIEHNSVGYKIDYEMHSMDFEEFLWARGYGSKNVEDMFAHVIGHNPFSSAEMDVYGALFLDYCILGGMPAVVNRYIEQGSFEGTLELQRQLAIDYEEDIRKYAEGVDQTRILNVFESVPVQLAKENKKFQITKVATGARFKDYRGCIEWLEQAGIISVCHCLLYPELPLRGNYDENKYKIYMRDTGLLVAQLDDEASDDLRANRNLGVYKGALYENFTAEALSKSGMGLFYYKKDDSTLEQDFFARTKSRLVPIEVKARRGTAKSLRTLIESASYPDIEYGIKLGAGNVGIEGGIRTFPHFCSFLLRRYLAEQD